MNMEKKLSFPLNLLLMDMAGAVLLGLGLAHHFAGLDFLPDFLKFENAGLVMAAAGIALMLPMLLFVIEKARSQREQG